MLLSDGDIVYARRFNGITVEPWDMELLNPASIDLRLGHQLRVPRAEARRIDLAHVPADHTELVEIDEDAGYTLFPGGFVLGSTLETIGLPPVYGARLEGKSSLARLGLTVHVTGGYIDPGFVGDLTLEIVNHAPWAIVLRRGARIAQLAFEAVVSVPMRDYSQVGSYQDQQGPTESRYRMGVPVSS